jgi:hypothetical protein
MWTDHLVEEIYQIRQEYLKQFNYDWQAIFDDLKEVERNSQQPVVSRPRLRKKWPVEKPPSTDN